MSRLLHSEVLSFSQVTAPVNASHSLQEVRLQKTAVDFFIGTVQTDFIGHKQLMRKTTLALRPVSSNFHKYEIHCEAVIVVESLPAASTLAFTGGKSTAPCFSAIIEVQCRCCKFH